MEENGSGALCRVLLYLMLCFALPTGLGEAHAAYDITRLTDNTYLEWEPQLNENGQVVWWSEVKRNGLLTGYVSEIFLYDGISVKKITDNGLDAVEPRINDQGKIVWLGQNEANIAIDPTAPFDYSYDVFLYDGETVRLTDVSKRNAFVDINGNGQVVWHAEDYNGSYLFSEIFLFDGTNTIMLTEDDDDGGRDLYPRINANGQVVWCGDNGIRMFDGGTVKQIPVEGICYGSNLQINDRGDVAWSATVGEDSEIYLYKEGVVTRLTDNDRMETGVRINGGGQVVWQGFDGEDYEIYLYDGAGTVQLTSNYYDDVTPRINDNGHVVWVGKKGAYRTQSFRPSENILNEEIFLYDGTGTTQLTRNEVPDREVEINNRGDIVWRGGSGEETEIYLAVKSGAGDAGYVSLIKWPTRNGDTLYCLDILDGSGEVIRRAVACGEGVHEYELADLDLSAGTYHWKVWSPSGYGGSGFEGRFSVDCLSPDVDFESNYGSLRWRYRAQDTFYCVDIFDADWNMLHQAVACGEGLHQYRPRELNLMPGTYRWKVWSPSGYGGQGFEGEFDVACGTSPPGFPSGFGWLPRGDDEFYCVDIFDAEGNMIHQAADCGNHRGYSPMDLKLPPGGYHWKIWSPSGYGGEGYEGDFSVTCAPSSPAWYSSYKEIRWEKRQEDTFYCVDLFDADGNMIRQAVACGEGLHGFTPFELNLPRGNYRWKVWSPSGYGGDGLEGEFSVECDSTISR